MFTSFKFDETRELHTEVGIQQTSTPQRKGVPENILVETLAFDTQKVFM